MNPGRNFLIFQMPCNRAAKAKNWQCVVCTQPMPS